MSIDRTRILGSIAMIAALLATAPGAEAGWPRSRRPRVVVVPTSASSPTASSARSRAAQGLAPSPMLGQFYPEPYLNIRGNFEAGGGYSPLGTFGDSSATLYGPLSAFRAEAAPVLMYRRGYDGSVRSEVGTGFSTPNFPPASNIVYPARANAVGTSRRITTPPQWESGINFIDLN